MSCTILFIITYNTLYITSIMRGKFLKHISKNKLFRKETTFDMMNVLKIDIYI